MDKVTVRMEEMQKDVKTLKDGMSEIATLLKAD